MIISSSLTVKPVLPKPGPPSRVQSRFPLRHQPLAPTTASGHSAGPPGPELSCFHRSFQGRACSRSASQPIRCPQFKAAVWSARRKPRHFGERFCSNNPQAKPVCCHRINGLPPIFRHMQSSKAGDKSIVHESAICNNLRVNRFMALLPQPIVDARETHCILPLAPKYPLAEPQTALNADQAATSTRQTPCRLARRPFRPACPTPWPSSHSTSGGTPHGPDRPNPDPDIRHLRLASPVPVIRQPRSRRTTTAPPAPVVRIGSQRPTSARPFFKPTDPCGSNQPAQDLPDVSQPADRPPVGRSCPDVERGPAPHDPDPGSRLPAPAPSRSRSFAGHRQQCPHRARASVRASGPAGSSVQPQRLTMTPVRPAGPAPSSRPHAAA